MKLNILFISLVLVALLSAEIPAGYYNSAEGLSGTALKAALNDIIDNHIEFSYDDLADFLLLDTDEDPDNSDNVILVYTQRSEPKSNWPQWNREHVWAKSHGDFGESAPCGTDAHSLHPCDMYVNSTRGNLDFDNGGTAVYDDGYLGGYKDSDSWEPPDHAKGDIARSILYMDVRYEGEHSELDLEVVDYVDSSPNYEPYHGKLSTLLEWNLQDPPDAFEIARNDKVYGYQENRNPFIDHPEYVSYIWGGDVPVDNFPPFVSSFELPDANTMILHFSEDLDQVSAETVTNYLISNGIGNPLSATLGYVGSNSSVQLDLSSLTLNFNYELTINNVEDLNENVIQPNSNLMFEISEDNIIWTEDFSSGNQYSVTLGGEGEDGIADYFIRTDGSNINKSYNGVTGYFFAGQDIDDGGWTGSASPSQITWTGIDISGQTDIEFSGDFGETYQSPGDIDNSDYLLVEYRIDGVGWNNLIAFENDGATYNTDFWEDTDFDGIGDGTTITSEAGTMVTFTKSVTETGFSLDLRFTASVNSGDEDFAIDNFKLSTAGGNPPLATPENVIILINGGNVNISWDTVIGATSYNIYSDSDPNGTFGTLEASTSSPSWSETLPTDTKKFYKITAQ